MERKSSLSFLFKRGEVYSYTHMTGASAGFENTAQWIDLGDRQVEIGMPVEMVTRKIRSDGDERGMLVYGYKFRPVLRAR